MTVEQELRDTLADRAGHALPADELADTVVRRVQRGRQRASVAGVALAVGVALVGGAVMSGTDGVRTAATSTSADPSGWETMPWWPSSSAPVPNTVMPELVGGWVPESLTGLLTGAADHGIDRNDLLIKFGADGNGRITDGCFWQQIVYRVDSNGGFSSELGPRTFPHCTDVAIDQVVGAAVRIEVRGEQLTFYDKAGAELGRYARSAG
ncbi:MAG: hypothetical protein ABIQ18_24685 [Umezawaea sp.]